MRACLRTMAFSLRRLYSSASASASASSIAASFLQTTQSLGPRTQTQLLDANQLQRLNATLSHASAPVSAGTPLPPCYHLVYFTPGDTESELGADGSDRAYNPPKPFTRRMWAGGELEWVQGNELRVGEEVTETTVLRSALAKRTRAGEEMIVVGVEKRFENERGVAVVDRRNWIFRPSISPLHPLTLPPQPPAVPLPSGLHTRDITQTPVRLFRFSALTFNAHKIHYNRDWCRTVEGHRDLVVHGPLNLIHVLDFWRDVVGKGSRPRKVEYRATSPFYVGETYRIVMAEEEDRRTEVRIVDGFGNVGMRGVVERF
ncbi:mesaconyl-C4 hydratase protein [Rutstroemia sp. NJR-2017a BVV2]|nr:mesaconyl-C4 hydratase protein [Rutstroemia sp. NJR-2017a BVV2]